MGLLDNLRGKAETLGEKAKDGFATVKDRAADGLDAAKDKASDLVDDVQERFDGEDTPPSGSEAAGVPERAEPVGDPVGGDAAPSGGGAADSSQGDYDEVLRAAELRAESLRNPDRPI